MCCEDMMDGCRVGELACEAAHLVVERRGIENTDPLRWAAIDKRMEAIELEAGSRRATSQAGRFLQACIGAGDATGREAKACLRELSCELAISTMTPLLAYYVDPKLEVPPSHVRPLPQDRPGRPGV